MTPAGPGGARPSFQTAVRQEAARSRSAPLPGESSPTGPAMRIAPLVSLSLDGAMPIGLGGMPTGLHGTLSKLGPQWRGHRSIENSPQSSPDVSPAGSPTGVSRRISLAGQPAHGTPVDWDRTGSDESPENLETQKAPNGKESPLRTSARDAKGSSTRESPVASDEGQASPKTQEPGLSPRTASADSCASESSDDWALPTTRPASAPPGTVEEPRPGIDRSISAPT